MCTIKYLKIYFISLSHEPYFMYKIKEQCQERKLVFQFNYLLVHRFYNVMVLYLICLIVL
jgi:hypothetical protein